MKKNKVVPVYKSRIEQNSPVRLKSSVAFKPPLSAAARVLRAIKTHDALKRLESLPGDETFDGPNYDELTPHQLVKDPVSGNEMTAGELHMLELERAQAFKDIEAAQQRNASRKQKAAQKKLAAPPPSKEEETEGSDEP